MFVERAESWHGCYDDGWRDLIVPEAFAHPAKAARGLLVRIFDELFAMGALERGDLVCDPFGGIGTTGIEAASRGCRFIGCELEPKFVALARENFEKHAATWAAMGRPQPVIVQGDSRLLSWNLMPWMFKPNSPRMESMATCVVSSPPYSRQMNEGGDTPAARGVGRNTWDQRPCEARGEHNPTRTYGTTPGQLGAMPAGDVAAVVSSPPYSAIASGAGGLNTQPPKHAGQQGGRSSESASQDTDQRYGESAGQLARLPEGAMADALVSSPPFEQSDSRGADSMAPNYFQRRDGQPFRRGASMTGYPASGGQLGQEHGDTFWTAARQIVAESYAVLKPGGTAVWIVKSFVRNKQIVDFPGNWRRLCEACGFETTREVHAMLVAEERTPHLWDGERVTKHERKSFFRRLAELKGSPAINFETVWFMRTRRYPGDARDHGTCG